MAIALELNHVWKKFHKGEFNDCLRDAIPTFFKSLVGLGPKKVELTQKDFWALSDIDFKVEEGERLGIIGHNGAGKSTLLKILSRILAPNCGSMKVNGRLRALIGIGAGRDLGFYISAFLYVANPPLILFKDFHADRKGDGGRDAAGALWNRIAGGPSAAGVPPENPQEYLLVGFSVRAECLPGRGERAHPAEHNQEKITFTRESLPSDIYFYTNRSHYLKMIYGPSLKNFWHKKRENGD